MPHNSKIYAICASFYQLVSSLQGKQENEETVFFFSICPIMAACREELFKTFHLSSYFPNKAFDSLFQMLCETVRPPITKTYARKGKTGN